MKKISWALGLVLFAASSIALAANQSTTADVIVIKTPKIQMSSMMGSNAAEVFMELDNKSRYPHFLKAAYSPVAAQTQLHLTVHQNGYESMRQVERILIKPNSDRQLQPGGLHVMLMGLKQPLKKGDTIPVVLIFSDGSNVSVNAQVG